jgi:hypothetical protein
MVGIVPQISIFEIIRPIKVLALPGGNGERSQKRR